MLLEVNIMAMDFFQIQPQSKLQKCEQMYDKFEKSFLANQIDDLLISDKMLS